MKLESYFYNCSPQYIQKIDPSLFDDIHRIIQQLPKRETQSQINADLFWLLTSLEWNYDTVLSGTGSNPPKDLNLGQSIGNIKERNERHYCLTSTTLNTRWHSDFAKQFGSNLVQLEAQFGKVEAMFKDFCGFRIAYAERRLALGIEIVLSNPMAYFAHRRYAIGGMANFKIAKDTLNSIGLDCPIWLVGINVS
jgi:hypothetical protein